LEPNGSGVVRVVRFREYKIGIHMHFKDIRAIHEAVDLNELAKYFKAQEVSRAIKHLL
jgi:hypothetical protein